MSSAAGPKIITDNLIFDIDIKNQKSNKGQPTTNLYTNGHLANGQKVVQETGSNPFNEIIYLPSNPGNSPYCVRSTAVGGIPQTEYQLTITTLQPNTTYCMSCWYGISIDWNGTADVMHSRWYTTTGTEAGVTGGVPYSVLDTKIIDGITWKYVYTTFTTGSNIGGQHDWYVGYAAYNTTGYRYFTNFQLEVGLYPTPFVDGTRSATQALVDLSTTNNIITANNVTFSNTAFNFNGINSKIIIDIPNNPSLYCLDITLKNYKAISSGIDMGPYYSAVGIHANGVGSNGMNLGKWTGSATNETISFWTSSGKLTYITDSINTEWNNYVFNWNGTEYDIWINGIKKQLYTTGTPLLLQNTSRIILGQNETWNYWFKGDIQYIKGYSKQLSDNDVKANFNALSTRII